MQKEDIYLRIQTPKWREKKRGAQWKNKTTKFQRAWKENKYPKEQKNTSLKEQRQQKRQKLLGFLKTKALRTPRDLQSTKAKSKALIENTTNHGAFKQKRKNQLDLSETCSLRIENAAIELKFQWKSNYRQSNCYFIKL